MSGFSRVSVPPSLRKTIHDIKEITGKHSDEDVYAVLKECNMDPNETAQKLLYLDTFHEVKKKRDTRKFSSNNRKLEETRQIPGIPKRGTRVGSYYSYSYNEGVGGKQVNGRKENGSNVATGKSSKSFVTAPPKESLMPAVVSSTGPANGSTSMCDGSHIHKSNFILSEKNARGLIDDAKDGYNNQPKKLPLQQPNLKQHSLYLEPIPTSTPTNTSKVVPEARNHGGNLKRNSGNLGDSVASPIALGSLGIIKNESESHKKTAEICADVLSDSRVNTVQNVTNGCAVSGSIDLDASNQSIEPQGIERFQVSKLLPLPFSSSHHSTHATGNDNPSVPQSDASEDNPSSHPILEDSLEQTASEIDVKLANLHISDGRPVIFPDHLHVPEALKKVLTFGSLEVPVHLENVDPNSKDVLKQTNVEGTKEPSPIHDAISPASGGNDINSTSDQSPAKMITNLEVSKENISSGNALKFEPTKQEILQPVGRSHSPLLPTTTEYGPDLVPSVVGSCIVKLDGHEPQGGKTSQIPSKASSTPSMAQSNPRGITQRSISVSPPWFPLLRQPYPPNYIPYGPYFSQLYIPPQNAHQLLSHGGFPPQPPSGNMYMPPTSTANSGVKFPVYKPGNTTPYRISPCYSSFGASGQPGMRGNNGAIARSRMKDKDVFSTLKQNEDFHMLSSTSGVGGDISALQANMFYNLPQGQPVAFPPHGHNSYAGIYHHPYQSISSPSLVQSQGSGGAVESMVPYPQGQGQGQGQGQLMPMSQHQYGHTNWNQKLLNRDV